MFDGLTRLLLTPARGQRSMVRGEKADGVQSVRKRLSLAPTRNAASMGSRTSPAHGARAAAFRSARGRASFTNARPGGRRAENRQRRIARSIAPVRRHQTRARTIRAFHRKARSGCWRKLTAYSRRSASRSRAEEALPRRNDSAGPRARSANGGASDASLLRRLLRPKERSTDHRTALLRGFAPSAASNGTRVFFFFFSETIPSRCSAA